MKRNIKKASATNKLRLASETVRALRDLELETVAGGAASQTCSNNTCDKLCRLN